MKKVKAIVTGGAGFIGSHIAEELSSGGYQVIIVDDLSTGKLTNIEPFLKKDAVEFVQGSITDLNLLQKLFKGATYVFHEAAIASVPRSVKDPIATHEVNVTGTLNVLIAARDNGVKKVIYASSCAIYGNDPALPKREDMAPDPQSPYAVNKLAAEYYCEVFHRVYGLPAVCLRYFNVYGPRQYPDSQYAAVIPKFIQKALEGKAPVIYGDGEQSRDFVFVKDVVSANLLAAESKANGIFNIGTGESISMNALADTIIGLSGKAITPIHEESRNGDIRHSLADISKAKIFGYHPKCRLDEGIGTIIRELAHENCVG
jgi:UDP-glucose 4-epimerase